MGNLRRLWALAALAALLASVALAVALALDRFPRGLSVLACLLVAALAAADALRAEGARRLAGTALAVAAVAGSIVFVVLEGRPLLNALVLVLFALSVAAARGAFRVHVRLPPAPAPQRAVLFYNPKSGGGKAERFHLAEEAARRGIATVELTLGSDLRELVEAAVRDGADALAMAGGDGSQAIVAAIAAEHGLPYACIPAGTRNHFALDLGVDRDDVAGALDAFVSGGERRVDLAEVNERIFVNNVSLGLYADAVQQSGYREAKLHTLLDTVPEVLGPNSQPAQLHWPGGRGGDSAVAVLVSNNPYRLHRALGAGTRPRLDRGVLGITVLMPIETDAHGGTKARLGAKEWTDTTFEIDAPGPVAAGIDGEATRLDPPLRFRTRPGALRVRIAPDHPGVSPSAIEPETPWLVVKALARFALFGDGDER